MGRGAYLCGPLARFNLNFDRLSPAVQALARRLGADAADAGTRFAPCSFACVEMVQAFEEAIAIIERYQPPAAPFVDAPLRAAVGCGGTEAPRGFLYHRYALDADGDDPRRRASCRPRRRNQLAIEEDFYALAPQLAALLRRRRDPPRGAGHPQPRPVHLVRDALSDAPEVERG